LLLNKNDEDYPDVAVVVTEVENLKRNLLLFTQVKDLEIPTILVINMADRMALKGIEFNIPLLEQELKTKIALISSRKKTGINELKVLLENYKNLPHNYLNSNYISNKETTNIDFQLLNNNDITKILIYE